MCLNMQVQSCHAALYFYFTGYGLQLINNMLLLVGKRKRLVLSTSTFCIHIIQNHRLLWQIQITCFSVMFEHCPYNHLLPRCKHGLCCAERWRIKQHQGAVALLLHLLLFPSAIIGTCHFWMSYSCWVVLCINFCLCFFGPFSFK